MAQMINNDNFNTSIESGVCVVDFFATWCGPCKMLAPVFEELSGEMDEVNFFKVDVDRSVRCCEKICNNNSSNNDNI